MVSHFIVFIGICQFFGFPLKDDYKKRYLNPITMTICQAISTLLLVALVRFLNKVWWVPLRLQSSLRSQGIKGPSYKFLYGNFKEIMKMKGEVMSRSNDIAHNIFPIIMPHMYDWRQIYGKNYLNWYGPQAVLVVSEPEMVKEVLGNKSGSFTKLKPQGHVKKLLGDGIMVSEGEKWWKLRKIANHTFLLENVKEMVPLMIECVETMLGRWNIGEEIDVYQEFKVLTSDVISRTAFGSSYSEGKNIFESLMKLGTIITTSYLKTRFPGIGYFVKSEDDIEAERADQVIRDSITRMIRKREERVMRGETKSYGQDLLGSLIKACHEDDESNRITTDVVIDECKLFYVAGQETTNGLVAWAMFLLAINKDWQDKAREEVLELFGKNNPHPEGITRLKIMSMILNETLRLYGPIVELTRKVEREVKLGNFTLPADLHLHIPLKALHHDPDLWGEDAHLFKPERFAQGLVMATNNISTAFVPFGFGHRICAGMNFAHNEVKIALSMILQRYEFTLSPTYVHSPIQILTVCPQHGIPLILKKLEI